MKQNLSLRGTMLAMVALIPAALVLHRTTADALLTFVVFGFLWRSWRDADWGWLRPLEHRLMLVLVLYTGAVVGVLSEAFPRAMVEGLVWLRFPLFFMALRSWLLCDAAGWKPLFWVVFATLLLVFLDSLVQAFWGVSLSGHATHGRRLSGPLTRPVVGMYMAKISLALIPAFLLMLWRGEIRRWAVPMMAVGLLSMIWLIIATGERTAMILFSAALAAVACITFWKIPRARLWVVIMVVLAVAGGDLQTRHNGFVQERVVLLEKQTSNIVRGSPYGQLWLASFLLWKEAPVLGHGIRSFRGLCKEVHEKGDVWYCDLHPHNHYVEWLVEAGGVGALGYILLAALLLWRIALPIWRSQKGDGMAMVAAGALGAWVICFSPLAATQSFFSNWPAILHWYVLALAFAALSYSEHASRSHQQKA